MNTTATALDVDFPWALLCNERALAFCWASSQKAQVRESCAIKCYYIFHVSRFVSKYSMSPHSELNISSGYRFRIKPFRNDPIYCWCINYFHNNQQSSLSLECNEISIGCYLFLAMYFLLHFSENGLTILHPVFPIHKNTTGYSHFKTWKQHPHTGITVNGGSWWLNLPPLLKEINTGTQDATFDGQKSYCWQYHRTR